MKTKAITVAVGLLYLMVALFAGNLHHHHHQGALVPDGQCAACVWHTNGVADAPLVFTPIHLQRVETPLRRDKVELAHVSVPLVFFSRAPPPVPA